MSTSKKEQSDTPQNDDKHVAFQTGTYQITTSTSVREVPFPNMEGPTYLIQYRGKDSGITKREIIVQWISEGNTAIWITAYCKLRNEVRKFNSENIVSMTDVQSGQIVVHPTKHLRLLNKRGF